MLPSIEKSLSFQNELKKFTEVQKNINDQSLKNEVNTMINKLIFEVKKIDTLHIDPSTFKEPTGLERTKENIALLRKELNKICKDHCESNR
jgi:non-homologous end joining protein Ku